MTVTSAALQGPRSVTTDAEGGYAFTALPPGDYDITFELSGFATIKQATAVPLGLVVEQNVTLTVAQVAETVQVVAETPGPIATAVVGGNFTRDEIEALATPRTLQGIAQLSPGLTENAPNANQVVINGAFAFDNAFMINGVDVNDNVFATPQNLFIEDAIQETQVLTSGISAEYGRFTGGVINAITKSGGNSFSGSVRMNFSNPAWTDETPFEKANNIDRTSNLQETYEATFGGPIVEDRLWFFSSGRYANTEASNTLPQTAIPYVQKDMNKRGEIKLTATLPRNHTIQGGYVNNARATTNDSGILALIVDPTSLITRSRPNRYVFTNYHGVLRDNLLAEAQYAERRSEFRGGGTSTNTLDSPIVAAFAVPVGIYNAPYFDTTDPDQRNNRQLTGSLTSFWNKAGRHQTKGGYEFYRSQIVGGNSQSSTSYVFWADYATDAAGKPLLDSTGRLIPVFVPGESALDHYPATRGAAQNNDSNSVYLQDHWAVNSYWSLDLGARFEHVRASSTGDIESVNANRIVPRLAVAYDVRGNGNHVAHVTYGQYSGRYNDAQINANSPVGNPPEIYSTYLGPAGRGRNFAPGFDIRNYPVAADTFVSVPTANVFVDSDLKSALVHEFSASYGANLLNGRGYAQAAYVYRKTTDMIDDFFTIADGVTHVMAYGVDVGVFSNRVFRNTDLAHRRYQGMVFQSRYRVSNRWTLSGHYTVQLENDGNFEGEATNQPGATSFIGNYPEAFNATRNFPDGRLQSFQRHRLRIWSIHNLSMGRFGDLSVSGLWRLDSGQVYSLRATNQRLTATQRAIIAAARYPGFPGSTGNSVHFGDRGSENFKGYSLFDTSINYNIPVFRSVRPWIKFDVYNVFDNDKLISWNTTVQQDPTSPTDSLGLATGYVKGATFGRMESTSNFPVPFSGATGGRTFLVAAGLRF